MVGFFPAANRRRIASIIVACLPVVALSAPLASADDDLKDKQKQVKKEINNAHDDLNEASAQLRKATAALDKAQAKLDVAQAKLAGTRKQLAAAQARDLAMQRKLTIARNELATARAELAQGRKDVLDQREAVGDLIAWMYEAGDPELIAMASILEAGDLSDIGRMVATNQALSDKENAVLIGFQQAELKLELIEAKVEAHKEDIALQRQAAAENLRLKKQLEQAAATQTAAVQSLVDTRSSAMQKAKAAKAHDAAVLASLQRRENRISAMLAARARDAAGSGGTADGFLSYPVNGYVTSPYGYRTHPIYGYYGLHNGVDFGGGCGTPLYASAGGTVVVRSYDSVYGNYLIVDHGGRAGVGLATRYNHASSYAVSSGERVDRGEVVGYMGSTGWSTGCHLHFSVLENGNYVDPMKWL